MCPFASAKEKMKNRTITIFGTSRAKAGDSIFALAFETGKLLARAGFAIANGGYDGTMLAAAKGAAEAGGEVIGVTCSAFKSSKANEYVTREIVTDTLDERLETLVELGQAYVTLPGGTGTLLELAKVWELRNKGFLKGDKPIIIVGEFWKPLVDLIAIDDPESSRYVELADDPQRAVEMINDI